MHRCPLLNWDGYHSGHGNVPALVSSAVLAAFLQPPHIEQWARAFSHDVSLNLQTINASPTHGSDPLPLQRPKWHAWFVAAALGSRWLDLLWFILDSLCHGMCQQLETWMCLHKCVFFD